MMNGIKRPAIVTPLSLLGWMSMAIVALGLSAGTAGAQEDEATRLRDALRTATTRLRSLEDQQAALRNRASQAEQQAAALQTELDTATAENEDLTEKLNTTQKSLTEAGRRIDSQDEAIGKMEEALANWKEAYDEAANVARAKEAERARLATELAAYTERATTCEANNAELFKIGNEILDRYESVDLDDLMKLREPFIGIKRVELETIVQDYEDKLLDQKVAQ